MLRKRLSTMLLSGVISPFLFLNFIKFCSTACVGGLSLVMVVLWGTEGAQRERGVWAGVTQYRKGGEEDSTDLKQKQNTGDRLE